MQDQNEIIDNIQSKFEREKGLLEEQLKTYQLLLEQVCMCHCRIALHLKFDFC